MTDRQSQLVMPTLYDRQEASKRCLHFMTPPMYDQQAKPASDASTIRRFYHTTGRQSQLATPLLFD